MEIIFYPAVLGRGPTRVGFPSAKLYDFLFSLFIYFFIRFSVFFLTAFNCLLQWLIIGPTVCPLQNLLSSLADRQGVDSGMTEGRDC